MLTLERTLLSLFSAALLVIILITAGAAFNAREGRHNYMLSRESYQRLLLMENLVTTLFEAESSQRAFLLTGENLFLQEHQAQRQRLNTYQSQLDTTDFTERIQQANAVRIRELISERLQLMDTVVSTFREQGAIAAADRVRSYDGKILMDSIRAVAADITAAERTSLDSRNALTEDHANELTMLLVAGAILNLLLLAGAYNITRRSLKRNKTLLTRLSHTSADISAVNHLSSSLQSCNTLTESATILQHFARQLFPDTRGGIYLLRASRNLLQLSASWNAENNPMTDPVEPQDCWALRLGKTYERTVDGKELSCHHLHDSHHTTLCIPLMAQSDIVGLLNIELQNTKDLEEIRVRAELMATHTSAALASVTLREALRQQSIRDPLTGLYNRRYLEEAMERELLRARRNKTGLSVLMIDIDHFKQFNDTHGHQAGDLLLKEFGEYLRRNVRGEDFACRYGGEEFLIVMPGCDGENARERAEILRQNLISLKVHYQGNILPAVTASFGVAFFTEHGEDRDTLIRSADASLYLAKRNGRNRVWVGGDSVSPVHASPGPA